MEILFQLKLDVNITDLASDSWFCMTLHEEDIAENY